MAAFQNGRRIDSVIAARLADHRIQPKPGIVTQQFMPQSIWPSFNGSAKNARSIPNLPV